MSAGEFMAESTEKETENTLRIQLYISNTLFTGLLERPTTVNVKGAIVGLLDNEPKARCSRLTVVVSRNTWTECRSSSCNKSVPSRWEKFLKLLFCYRL